MREKTVLFVYDIATGKELPRFEGLDRDEQADYSWIDGYYPQYGWFPDNRSRRDLGQGQALERRYGYRRNEGNSFQRSLASPDHGCRRYTHDLAPKSIKVRAIRQLAYSPDDRVVVFNALGRLWRKQDDASPLA